MDNPVHPTKKFLRCDIVEQDNSLQVHTENRARIHMREMCYFAHLSFCRFKSCYVDTENKNKIFHNFTSIMLLEVSEPFWKTVEFYCCLFTAIIVIMYARYRHRIKQLKRMAEVRQRIARDLHDDIGSTLSSISMLSKMAASGSPAINEK